MMAPVLDDFARAHLGDILVLKLDTDANPATPARLGIRGIPTLIVFEHGRESRRQVGAVRTAELEQLAGLGGDGGRG
jgi:thioredoxin 1